MGEFSSDSAAAVGTSVGWTRPHCRTLWACLGPCSPSSCPSFAGAHSHESKTDSNVGPSRWTCPLRRAHLEERKALGLVEDQVLVNEGALGGHALVACAQLVLQGALNAARDQSALTRGGRLHLLPSMSSWTRLWQCQISLCAHSCVSEACSQHF